MNKISYDSLDRAITTLERAYTRAQEWHTRDEELFLILRDGTIQRFEYTYEQAWKLVKRTLKDDYLAPEDVESLTRRDLFRHAAEFGFIKDPKPWFGYHDARNETSHAYESERAAAVYALIPQLISDARDLYAVLKSRGQSR